MLNVLKVGNDEIRLESLERKIKKSVIFEKDGTQTTIENFSYERSEIQIRKSPKIIVVVHGGRSLKRIIAAISQANEYDLWVEPVCIKPSLVLERIRGEVSVLGAKIVGINYSKTFGGQMYVSGEGSLEELLSKLKKKQKISAIECKIGADDGSFRMILREFGSVSISKISRIESNRLVDLLTQSVSKEVS